MTTNLSDPDLIFFLGAGASVEAGVPDTFRMASEFIKEFETDTYVQGHKRKIYHPFKRIIRVLSKWNKDRKVDDIDVEQVLETLEKLENRDEEVLLYFADKRYFNLKPYADITSIIRLLKDFIKRKAAVNEQQVLYLLPLLDFIEPNPFQSLVIFSVNYDTCIEQLCNTYKKRYTDGFNIYWNPKEFERPDYDVKIYKIHGSVMWFQTDRKDYVKIPVRTDTSQIELITGESANPLIFYPMRKFEYIEPLTEMQIEFRRKLEKTNTKYIIIVGYSFRDEYIIHMLWDAARKNRNLIVLLVNPNAKLIYENKLRYYDRDSKIPSSLEGRVVLLPYKFGKVLPKLKNTYLKDLRKARRDEQSLLETERQGTPPNWAQCLETYAKCEFTFKVKLLLNKVNWGELGWKQKSIIGFNMLMQSASTRDGDSSFWKNEVDKLLVALSVDRLVLVLEAAESNQYVIRVGFQQEGSSMWNFHQIESRAKVFGETYNIKKDHLPHQPRKMIKPLVDRLSLFLERCRSVNEKNLEDYVQEMKGNYPSEIEELHSMMDKADYRVRVSQIITKIERKEIEKIFKGNVLKISQAKTGKKGED